MSELTFRQAMAKLVQPHEKVVPTDPLKDTLAAFRMVLKQDVEPDAALFKDIAMDSLDLMEVTIALDEVYGDHEWQPLFDAIGTRFALNQHPALTPKMISDYLGEGHRIPPAHS